VIISRRPYIKIEKTKKDLDITDFFNSDNKAKLISGLDASDHETDWLEDPSYNSVKGNIYHNFMNHNDD
jgi:hypothetical protein